ncbi:MAG: 6-bladed beta-propeller [Bacteroidales bacterium]|nr:6-bladed beta-propeller [Bacteroidales bacterium]
MEFKGTCLNFEESLSPVAHLDDYVSKYEIIELSDDVPLPSCSKMLFDRKEESYIFLTNAGIYRYNKEGTFVGRYGEVGRGPGEYLKIYDICISLDGNSLMCLDHENNIMVYSLKDLSFIKKICTNAKSLGLPNGTGIAPSKNGNFFIYVPNPVNYSNPDERFNCLYEFNEDGEKTGEFIAHRDFNIDMTSLFPFMTQNNDSYFLRPQENENILYQIHDGEILPFARISFGAKDADPLFCYKDGLDPWMNLSDFLSENFFKLPFNYFETQTHSTISAFGPNQAVYTFVINKKSNKIISWNIGNNPICPPLFFVGTDGEFFYVLFDKFGIEKQNIPNNYPDALLRYLKLNCRISPKATGNPYIIKIKFC